MRRREFLGLIGGAAAEWANVACAEQAPTAIGYLSARSPDESKHLLAAFREGLKSEGYVEGQNIELRYRWAEGHYDRLPAMAAELVRDNVAMLIATGGEPSALAAKAATSTIPIVFTVGGDPVRIGLVASLNRPGGNATGVSLLTTAPEVKRFSLLHQVVPSAATIGVLINPNYRGGQPTFRSINRSSSSSLSTSRPRRPRASRSRTSCSRSQTK
jgi:putative ABC transport system substrate-binding protein